MVIHSTVEKRAKRMPDITVETTFFFDILLNFKNVLMLIYFLMHAERTADDKTALAYCIPPSFISLQK